MEQENAVDVSGEVLTMFDILSSKRADNRTRRIYYDSKQKVKDLRLGSIPPGMRNAKSSIGWARLVVDVIAERIRLIGFYEDSESGLSTILREHGNATEIATAISESLLYGVGFISLSVGSDDSPVIITAEDPNFTTILTDRRTRRVTAAMTIESWEKYGQTRGWYHNDNFSVPFIKDKNQVFIDEKREVIEHGYGFVPVFPIKNRPSSSGSIGRSEITDAIIGYVDAAGRTLLEMEIGRSLYANPRIYYRGADDEMFMNEDGSRRDIAAESQLAAVNLPPNSNDSNPDVTVVNGGSPDAFTGVLRAIATQVSSESSIPVYRMNLADSNPTSAEAILASEIPLNSRCESKISTLIPQFREIGRAILRLMGYDDPAALKTYSEPIFAEPKSVTTTPTVDGLVAAGILQPDSMIVHQRIGLSPEESRIVAAENDRAAGMALLQTLVAREEGLSTSEQIASNGQ